MKLKLTVLLSVVTLLGRSQSVAPTVVATCGDFYSSSTESVAWTIGEVVSETYSNSVNYLTQGFHQPNERIPAAPEEPTDFFNGFSPNGDDVNDWWNIPVLSYYTTNTVMIINRWGEQVWVTNDYNNLGTVFNGQNLSGKDLPDGTYYYIIRYSDKEKRGWVFIKR